MLGNLINKASLDSPGEDFTSRVMKQVQAIGSVDTAVYQPLLSTKMWFVIGFALATLIGTIFFIDFSFLGSIFEGVSMDQPQFFTLFAGMLNSAGKFFEGVKISSITMVIFIAIGLLIIIERLLRKPKVTNSLMV